MKYKVMFVCMGNICRSPLAHALFNDLVLKRALQDKIYIESSGISGYHVGEQWDGRMNRVAKNNGINFSHQSRRFTRALLEEYDLVLAMDSINLKDIEAMDWQGQFKDKIHLFREFDPENWDSMDVPDPYYDGAEGFVKVFDIVDRTVEKLLDWIISNEGLDN